MSQPPPSVPPGGEPPALEARVEILEREVARLRELRERLGLIAGDAAAARVLAAGADRDVSEVRAELRAHTTVLNALREDQLALHTELGVLRTETRAGFATLGAGMAHITELLEGLTDSS